MVESYVNYDIHVASSVDGHRIFAESEPTGEARADVAAALGEIDLGRFWDASAPAPRARLMALGAQLFDALFTGEIRANYDRVLAVAHERQCSVRIRLDLTDAPALVVAPWEAMYDARTQHFLALSTESSLVRYLQVSRPAEGVEVRPPLRVLVVMANPADLPSLDVEQEWRRLKEAVVELEARGTLSLDRLDRATPGALQRALRRASYHILHFIGHAYFDEGQRSEPLLILEDDDGRARVMENEWLSALLQNSRFLRLIVLNACAAALTSPYIIDAGIAQSLIKQGIPAVLAMQTTITDHGAATFGHEFYAALSDGRPVDAALTDARLALAAEGDEWVAPVLYLRHLNGRLFDLSHAQATEQPPAALRRLGAFFLALGAAGIVLLYGLGYVLLEPFPALRNGIAAMGALLGGLLAFFGVRGQAAWLRGWSQAACRLRWMQGGLVALFAVSLILWGVVGIPAIQAGDCDPVLGCKAAQEQWYVLASWETLVPLDTAYEQVLVSTTQRNLDQKLSLVDGLRSVPYDRSQQSAKVSDAVDIWIKGDYQNLNGPELTAEIAEPAASFYQTVSVTGAADEVVRAAETCLLDMQNRLALAILETLDVSPSTAAVEAMRRTPTASCEALKLNNDAATLILEQTDLVRAMIMLEQAVQLDPQYADAHNSLGAVYEQLGEYDRSIAHYQQALQAQESALFYFNLGRAQLLRGDAQAAVAANERAIALDPTFADAYNNLGAAYLALDDIERAFAAIQTGLQLDDDLPTLHKNLGRALLAQDRPAEAVTALTRANQLFGGAYMEAIYYLALAHHDLGDDATACATLNAYLPLSQDAAARRQAWRCEQPVTLHPTAPPGQHPPAAATPIDTAFVATLTFVEGEVYVDNAAQPASPFTPLRNGATVETRGDSRATVVYYSGQVQQTSGNRVVHVAAGACHNCAPAPVASARTIGPGPACVWIEESCRLRGDTLEAEADYGNAPVILNPRNTNLMTLNPMLEWVGVSDAVGYELRLSHATPFPSVVLAADALPCAPQPWTEPHPVCAASWPAQWPLAPGETYFVEVSARTGIALPPITSEKIRITTLPADRAEAVMAEVEDTRSLSLDAITENTLLAGLFLANQLWSEAIPAYRQTSAAAGDSAAQLFVRLGDSYRAIDLQRFAYLAYAEALRLLDHGPDNPLLRANAEFGQGQVEYNRRNYAAAIHHFEQAVALYNQAGSEEGLAAAQDGLAKATERLP